MESRNLKDVITDLHTLLAKGPSEEEKALRREYHEILKRDKVPYWEAYFTTWKLSRDAAEFCDIMTRVRPTVLSYGG